LLAVMLGLEIELHFIGQYAHFLLVVYERRFISSRRPRMFLTKDLTRVVVENIDALMSQ